MWALLAEPARWQERSPHVAGGEGLGRPEVEEGAVGAVVLRGGVRTGAGILEVIPGRSWAWQVKGLRIRHDVHPRSGGTRITMTPSGSGPIWSRFAAGHRLPTALIARDVARVAASSR